MVVCGGGGACTCTSGGGTKAGGSGVNLGGGGNSITLGGGGGALTSSMILVSMGALITWHDPCAEPIHQRPQQHNVEGNGDANAGRRYGRALLGWTKLIG